MRERREGEERIDEREKRGEMRGEERIDEREKRG